MVKFSEIRKEGDGLYCIYVAGELVTTAKNPKAAKEKLAVETARATMNAQRAATNAAWCAANPESAYLIAERAGMVAA